VKWCSSSRGRTVHLHELLKPAQALCHEFQPLRAEEDEPLRAEDLLLEVVVEGEAMGKLH
jgi:hypothetical protein